MFRGTSKGTAMLLLSSLLGACGGGAAPSAAPSQPATSSEAASKPAVSPASASPTAGKPAASTATAESIKAGIVVPLTGPTSIAGKENIDGFNLYLASVNGAMAGRKIEVVNADTAGQADVALTKTKALVESSKVNVLMGLTLSPECLAVAGYVKEVHVPTIISDNCGLGGLTTDPKIASPYIVRTTFSSQQLTWPLADWAYKQGYRKAALIASDYGGGLEVTDSWASAFVRRGGSIVQELHPALGTADFGPFLAQLDKSADVLVEFTPGIDGLRFGEQYGNYVSGRKLPVVVIAAVVTRGSNLLGLKDKAIGLVNGDIYSEALDTPSNKQFLQLFKAKYPNDVVSTDHMGGYVGAQVLEAALKKVNGNIEQTPQFLEALYATDTDTAKGTIKLDKYHDVIENNYIYELVKQEGAVTGVGQKLLQTYPNLTQFGDLPEEQARAFPWGKLKGQWVGMTKDKLAAVGK